MRELPELFRLLAGTFGILLGLVVLGMTALSLPPQDGLVFYAAGTLADEGQWDAIYPQIGADGPTFRPAFREAYCGRLEERHGPCEGVILPFVSPPVALPWVRAWALLPYAGAIAGVRALGVACLLGAAWWASASAVRQQASLGLPLGLALLFALPAAMSPIELGQNTPWLLAAAGIMVVAARERSAALDVLAGILLAACATFKGSPGLLALLWLWPFRPWSLGAFSAVMLLGAAIAGLMTPGSLWGSYALMSTAFAGWVVDFRGNCTVEAAFRGVGAPAWLLSAIWPLKALLVSGGAVAAQRAGVGPAGRAALGWGAWLALLPLVWGHYLWVAWVLVVGLVLGRTRGLTRAALVGWSLGPTPLLVLLTQAPSAASTAVAAGWLVVGVAALFGAAVTRGGDFGAGAATAAVPEGEP